LVPVR
jgi:antitoxin HicB